MESVKLIYGNEEIDLSFFNGNEVGLIRKYTEKRIRQIELEKEFKRELDKEQKRKDLINLFKD